MIPTILSNIFFKKIIRHWLFVFFLLISNSTFAQVYNFRHYGLEDGLPQGNSNWLIQDNKGFIWIATQGGVCKFDGKEFLTYTIKDGLVDNIAEVIFQDSKGKIWIGTRKGLSCLDNGKFTNYKTEDGLSDNVVMTILEDKQHNIWVGTYSQISRLKNGKFETFALDTGKVGVFAMYEDIKGKIWAGTGNGVYVIEQERVVRLPILDSLNQNIITDIKEDNHGSIWIATKKGVFRLEGETLTKFSKAAGLQDDIIDDILVDSQNNIWFGTEGKGISKYDGQKFSYFNEKEGLKNSSVLSLLEDAEQNIWIGFRGGLAVLNLNHPFIHYTESQGISNNIYGISEDKKGHIWLSSYGNGLFEFDGQYFKNYDKIETLTDNCFFSSLEDDNGIHWFASSKKGVFSYNKNKFTQLQDNQTIANERVFDIIKDKNNHIWLATRHSGLIEYDGRTVKYRKETDGLSSNNIFCIHNDTKGNIWIGTITKGLSKFDGEKFTNFGTTEGLKAGLIRAITEDKKGNIWLGSAQDGVIKVSENNPVQFTYITEEQGLNSNNIYTLLVDSKNQLWAGTERGINKIIFDKAGKIEEIQTYGKEDGFIGIESNANGILEDRKGNLWFSNQIGITAFRPHLEQKNPNPSKTYIKNVRLFFEKVDWKKFADSLDIHQLPTHLALPHYQNHLSFDFVGICFTNPKKVRYQFILEGADTKWSPITDKNEAVYANLSYGTYTFKVKSCNNDGLWNETPASFTFTILPPWWQTWWFRASLVTLFFLIGYFFYQFRVAGLKKRKQELEREVKERTSEITLQKEEIAVQRDRILETQNALALANEELMTLNSSLEYRVQERTAALLKANEEIKESLFKGQSIERKRVAIELHDNLGALLSALKLNVEAIHVENLNEQEQKIYTNVVQMMDNAVAEVRFISHNLLPVVLEKEGFIKALQNLIYKLNLSDKLHFELDIFGLEEANQISKEIEFNVYNICLELTNNIIKHAQATQATIQLILQDSYLSLVIEDNGKGINEENQKGMGLKNIQERLQTMNATWQIDSSPQSGTSINIEIPI